MNSKGKKRMDTKAQLTRKISVLEDEINQAYRNSQHKECTSLLKSVYYDRAAFLESQLHEMKQILKNRGDK